MAGVSDYIDEHFDDTLGKLSAWCSQPSVSTEGLGVEAMAELAAATLLQSGFEVAVHATQGYPIILADTGPSDAPAILIYNHYDVQPVGDPAEWASDPFAPEVRDGKMYARGVADTKSNIVARLDALNAVRAARGTLPVRIIWLLEGEEEIGSPNLDAFIAAHRGQLHAEGCIWEFGTYTWDGTPNVTLGLKGMLSIELTARGASRDLHSAQAAFVPSPVWRLIWALAALKTPDNQIHIPGFYDAIVSPSEAHLHMIGSAPDDTARERASLGIPAFINGMQGADVYRASAFDPTANILGIEAGYNGPGSKTVLPREARAKLDLRLVPDQDPQAIFESLQRFLKDQGFDDVEVSRVEGEGDLLPARSDPSAPFIQRVLHACREVSSKDPVIVPSSGGSGPMAPFTMPRPRGLGLPTAGIGTGYPDSRAHGPNENIRLSDLRAHMHTFASLIMSYEL